MKQAFSTYGMASAVIVKMLLEVIHAASCQTKRLKINGHARIIGIT
jgi:hypothetical protein